MLIGAGCLRVILALAQEGNSFGVSLAATAVGWILCAASLILLALWDWHVQEHHPGASSFLRKLSYGAVAGSLLPCAASLLSFTGLGAAPALAAALAGLALTLFSATLWEWLLKDIDLDAPPLSESIVMARLAALREIAERCAWGTVSRKRSANEAPQQGRSHANGRVLGSTAGGWQLRSRDRGSQAGAYDS
jgi:hypothetical protein